MCESHTSVHIFLGIQLQRNSQIQAHLGDKESLHYTLGLIFTNEENYHKQQTQLSPHFIPSMIDQHDETQWF